MDILDVGALCSSSRLKTTAVDLQKENNCSEKMASLLCNFQHGKLDHSYPSRTCSGHSLGALKLDHSVKQLLQNLGSPGGCLYSQNDDGD